MRGIVSQLNFVLCLLALVRLQKNHPGLAKPRPPLLCKEGSLVMRDLRYYLGLRRNVEFVARAQAGMHDFVTS